MIADKLKAEGWEFVGEIHVDSAQVILLDPCYIRVNYDNFDDFYKRACEEKGKWYEHNEVATYPVAGMAHGICVPSGVGDGAYPVWIRRFDAGSGWGFRVSAMMVDFFPGEDD